MVELLLTEAGEMGLLDHECPDVEDEGQMVEHIIGLMYLNGYTSQADSYRKEML